MSQLHPVNQALLVVFDNQVARTAATLEGLTEREWTAPPGGDCHTIQGLVQHLLELRRFQLTLLESPLVAAAPDPRGPNHLADARSRLDAAAAVVRRALEEHDPADWFAVPAPPRPVRWGDEPTLARVVRPLNDFTNHLGALRALRRIFGNPAPRTQ